MRLNLTGTKLMWMLLSGMEACHVSLYQIIARQLLYIQTYMILKSMRLTMR